MLSTPKGRIAQNCCMWKNRFRSAVLRIQGFAFSMRYHCCFSATEVSSELPTPISSELATISEPEHSEDSSKPDPTTEDSFKPEHTEDPSKPERTEDLSKPEHTEDPSTEDSPKTDDPEWIQI